MAAPKYISEQFVKQFFTAETVAARPTGWTIALHAGNPGTGDANEAVDANYARQSATFTASDAGAFWEGANAADITFPAAAAGANYTATHYSVRNATGGAALAVAALPVPIPVVAGGVITIPAGFAKVRGV